MNETRLQEIERQLAELKTASLQRAGQLEMPLDPTTQELLKNFIESNSTVEAYPIGAIFISTVADNPSTLLGYGTWSAIGAGKVLVGQDTEDTDFDTLEETGGAKTHTLTVAQMPSHDHPADYSTSIFYKEGANGSTPVGTGTTTIDRTYAVKAQGGGEAHNNLQPYLVVKMWERTA